MDSACAPARNVTSPAEFFGFRMGDDRKIARWDKMVEYFHLLASESDRIRITELGKSTEGQPFILATISSPANLADLERFRQLNLRLNDPRGLTDEAARSLAKEGKAVVCQSMSLHGNEIGGTQMAPELAYDLLSGASEEVRRILDDVIFLMVPCFNPDGQVMTTDWYNRYLGTRHEGCGLPWLYQKYSGHDNNRDAVMQNLPESQYVAKILFRDWIPQAYQDHHHMGAEGIRLYISPYSEPIRPGADPLVWRELAWYGAHMAYRLEEQGKQGVIGGSHWSAWGHLGFHRVTVLHNIAGMLTESASAKLATPMYVHPGQLRGTDPKTHPTYEAQTNFPNPWPGGWWRLRDIVGQQKIASMAVLDIAAAYKETVLWNTYVKAKRQTETGPKGGAHAYVIPARQHDPSEALRLVRLLLDQGVEVLKAGAPFRAGDLAFDSGTHVVPLAQPKAGVIKALLGRTLYPDSYWTRNPDGSPMVYDVATDTVSEYLGVDVVPVTSGAEFVAEDSDPESVLEADGCFARVTDAEVDAALRPSAPEAGSYLDCRRNDTYLKVNRLLKEGVKVWRLDERLPASTSQTELPAGSFWVEGQGRAPDAAKHPARNLRVGVYQRYWGGNMDEGWTRYVLDGFEFPYTTVMDSDFEGDRLSEKIDVLVFPSDSRQMILGPDRSGKAPARFSEDMVPPEYRSGIGAEGTQAVKKFVERGGRLVAFDQACNFAIEALGLRLRNVTEGLNWKEFHCHGSTLRVEVDTFSPFGYGMPEKALVFNLQSPAFDVTETFNADAYQVIVKYAGRDVLQSGWLGGEERIAGKAAMVRAGVGKGEAVLIGFRPQFRAQTHGTYKFLFNCLQ